MQITSLSGITAIATGYGHSLALKEDGTVWAWGYILYSQPGGSATQYTIPVPVTSLSSGITAITAGGGHSMALKEDGTIWAWGDNACSQLGEGPYYPTPLLVSSF